MMKLFQSQTREIGPFNGSSEFWVTGTLSAKGKRELHARGFTVVEQVGGRIYSREPAPNLRASLAQAVGPVTSPPRRSRLTSFGSVNASRENFDAAVWALGEWVQLWPDAVRGPMTGRFPIEEAPKFLDRRRASRK